VAVGRLASAQAPSAEAPGSSEMPWTARSQCAKAARLVVAACSAEDMSGCGLGLRVQPCVGLERVPDGRGLIMGSGRVYMPPTQGGAIAQLGERLNGIQEVVGSIPIGSTNNINDLQKSPVSWTENVPNVSLLEHGPMAPALATLMMQAP
jgi:hypothetical protein